jgi:predicted lipid-binding transport protein (Tim44 family)
MNPREPLLLTWSGGGRNWLARVLVTTLGVVVAIGLAVTAFFFLTVALVVGTFLVAIIAVRWWWMMRRLRARQQVTGPLEGEYTRVRDADSHAPVNDPRRSNDLY